MITNILLLTLLQAIPIIVFKEINIVKKNKIRLKRISEYDGCIISSGPNIENINYKIDIEKNKIILPLLEKLFDYTKESNLKTIYKNLQTSNIIRKPLLLFGSSSGYYDTELNKIEYYSYSSLKHEFLHMASTYYDNNTDTAYTGFKQYKNGISIGIGLNEGYTELLTARIYNKGKIEAYPKEVKIAKLFELFFDNPKDMEDYYFNYNLPSFIHYMEKYAKKEDIIKLMLDIDSITYIERSTFINPLPSYNYIKTQIILYNWFISKNNDKRKIEQFENLICKNKIIDIILKKEKLSLCKSNPYDLHLSEDNYKHIK